MSKQDELPTCQDCRTTVVLDHVGSATGLKYYRCPNPECNATWREKRIAAVVSGSIGGKNAAANMTPAQRTARAEDAAKKRWDREKLDDVFAEVIKEQPVAPHRLFRSKRS